MADSNSDGSTQDRDRISFSDDHDIRGWAKALGVSEESLCEAVEAVGTSASAVRAYLKS